MSHSVLDPFEKRRRERRGGRDRRTNERRSRLWTRPDTVEQRLALRRLEYRRSLLNRRAS